MNRPVPVRVLWALVALFAASAAALVVLYFVTSDSSNTDQAKKATEQAKKNEDLIKELQDQIASSNSGVEADRQVEADRVECVTRFTYAIQSASSDLLVELGDLVIVIATTIPGPDREAKVGDGVDKVRVAVDKYRWTVRQRVDFDVKGSPLPCPIKADLKS